MKILLTGHHGYIGSVMGPMLAAAGHDVVGWDAFFFRGCDFEKDRLRIPGKCVDTRDRLTPEDLAAFDAVIHYAALSNDPIGQLNPTITEDINFRATAALARSARSAGVRRFVFASSCSIYGSTGEDSLMAETGRLAPLTAYAVSKARSEEELSRLADSHFSPVYMRNATAFGVSPRLRLDLVLNNLSGWAVTTRHVKILSNGAPWRPIVHVEDIGRTVLALLAAPLEVIHDQAFNVGLNSQNYRVREIAQIVQETLPGCAVEHAGTGEPDARSYRVDFGKLARTLPDLRLKWTAQQGARELADAYRTYGLTIDDLHGGRFLRLNHLKHLIQTGELGADLRRRTLRGDESRTDAS
jgi:nucleoside-diphosphate-sugar epimerase